MKNSKSDSPKKLTKSQYNLMRVIVSIVLFFTFFLVFKFVAVPWYAQLIVYLAIYLFIAYDVLIRAARNICHGQVFDENFLMIVATVGAFAVQSYPEAVAVMMFYQLGEWFQSYAVNKSRRSIAALMDIRPDKTCVLKDGVERVVDPDEVEIGDVLVVRPGEKIPVDGTVVKGASALNTSALTGESAPLECKEGDAVISGAINVSGLLHIRADKAFCDSTVSKILDLVENASSKKAKSENFITKFAKYYTPIVVGCAVVLAIVPSAITGNWSQWVYRALSFLVVSCPCALVISVPLSFFGGIGGASKQGILVKGGNYLELLDKANVFVFDKTGTLTKGKFEVQKVLPSVDHTVSDVLSSAVIAESNSNHPIAQSVLSEAKKAGVEVDAKADSVEEIAGKGIKAISAEHCVLAGNASLLVGNGIDFAPSDEFGTIVYVARDGVYLGAIVIADSLKDDTKDAISLLKGTNCKTVMLTGDNATVAQKIALDVGISDFKAGLLPDGKVAALESILADKKKNDVVAFVGDGINDAPVLMRSDLGISLGGIGSDAAIEASDIVLMHDTLGSIPVAKRIARKTMSIVYENIVFALAVKLIVLVLSAVGIANMWLAVFADVGVAFLAILNAMRAMRVSDGSTLLRRAKIRSKARV